MSYFSKVNCEKEDKCDGCFAVSKFNVDKSSGKPEFIKLLTFRNVMGKEIFSECYNHRKQVKYNLTCKKCKLFVAQPFNYMFSATKNTKQKSYIKNIKALMVSKIKCKGM